MQTLPVTEQPFRIYALSESAVTIEFGNEISEQTLQKVTAFNHWLQQNPFPGYITAVPAYSTLTVFFDPLRVFQNPALTGAGCFEKVKSHLMRFITGDEEAVTDNQNIITIPVCYGGIHGPDLEFVANSCLLPRHEVVLLHSAVVYKVFMMGFVPGFAYLGGMPEILATPRKPVPRGSVPAGAVGIAGTQTGIYPLAIPGGWQIIGRTPLRLFNPHLPQPSLLKAGDHVQFKPIGETEFERLANQTHADKDQ